MSNTFIDGFCGDPLADDFLPLLNSSQIPVPSECFLHTVFAGLPCLIFWLLLPVVIQQIRLSRAPPLPWSALYGIKWLLASTLLIDRTFVLVIGVWRKLFDSDSTPTVNIVYPIVMAVTLLALLITTNECRRAGLHSPGFLFCCWLVFSLFGFPEFYMWIKIGSDKTLVGGIDFFQYVAYLVYFPLVLLQLFLHCFADPLTIFEKNGSQPESKASFLNRQMLWWFGDLVAKGNKKPLEVDDLYDLDQDLDMEYLSSKWNMEWNLVLRDYEMRKRAHSNKTDVNRKETSPLLSSNTTKYGTDIVNQCKTSDAIQPPSIIYVLWRMYKWEFLGATIIKFFCDILQYANPGFLNLLITFTEDPEAPWAEGLMYAVGLFLAGFLRSILMNNYFTLMFRVGTKIQSTLTTAVYNKTIHLSNSSRRQKTQGEIVNLMSIDVDRFRMITPQLQQYWSSPMQIFICMVLLWQSVGYAVLTGFVIMVSLIPINIFFTVISKKWTVQQMQLKDERVKMTNEVLGGIKVVKLYAWEPALEAAIDDIRRKEMSLVRKASVVKTIADMLNIASPFLVALVTFATYTLTSPSHVLTPQIAFVSLTLFNQLRGPLIMAADLLSQTIQVVVSNKRLKDFLVADELSDTAIDKEDCGEFYDNSVEMDTAVFTWDREGPIQLNNLDLKIKQRHLTAVVGPVGAGKSSLLMALLGEMEKLRGYIGIRGTIAFVPQQPWIQNKTLRENILMNKPYNKVLYDEVIEACALKQDFALLPFGDYTEIGEKGINLSGGQKARIVLARAVYQDKDIYLLDDPLSAVDVHVASHIFDHVIGPRGLLAKKTRILVTHRLSFLKETDEVIIMRDGNINHFDTFDNLLENEETAEFLRETEVQKSEEITTSESTTGSERAADDELDSREDEVSTVSRRSKSCRKSTKSTIDPTVQILIEKERAETGRVKFSVYVDYFRSMGIFRYFVPFCISLICNSIFIMLRSLWLTDWSNDNIMGADPSKATPLGTRLGVYAAFGFAEVLFLYISLTTLILGGVAASLQLHRPLLQNILRSPLSYFDVTPLGRILNRLGKDMEVVDLRLPSNFRFLAVAFMNVLQTCIIISISTPLFIGIIIPIFIIYFFILRYFITTSRQLQRLASMTRSPIYSHFGETIQGSTTIRAFEWTKIFKEQNKQKLETHVRCSYFSLISNRWLSIRLELLGNIIILATALLAVISKDWGTMTAGVIGLSVSYSLNITFMLNMFVRQVSEVETNVVAVERIEEYMHIPTEGAWRSNRLLPPGWPSKGRISLRDYSTRYRPGLDLVLKGLNINITSGEKIGVVGRTGAGKSSLTLALFRIIEPADGQIILDDIDISTIGLHDLREHLSIIPQDPVLFSGTLRFNLDPTGVYSDAELWTALEHANMKHFVESFAKGIDHNIDEGGENISVGQRQLVCLTRALLRKSRVLVLDEATAAVDAQTDALIQATIRNEFAESTVITIAHRLNTVLDYDRIMVMVNGQLAEFDKPQQLLANKSSLFYSMASSAKII